MNLGILHAIHDLIEQPSPQDTIAALRTQLATHHAALHKTLTLLSTWETLDTHQAGSLYADVADRNAFREHLLETVSALRATPLPQPLFDETQDLLGEADTFQQLCRQVGTMCLQRMTPLTAQEQTSRMPISRLPELLDTLRDAINRQNEANLFFDKAVTGKIDLSLRHVALAEVDVQFNLDATHHYRRTLRHWATQPLNAHQRNQLVAAGGLLDTLTASVFHIQKLCHTLRQRYEHQSPTTLH